jgi:glycosyltransferase involved in cell wall biosynthesis
MMAGKDALTRLGRARDRALQRLARVVYRDPVASRGRLALWLAYGARMAEPEHLTAIVRANLEEHGPAILGEAAAAAMGKLDGARARRALFTTAWGALRERDVAAALAFADPFIDEIDHERIAVTMARLMNERGAIVRPLALLERHRQRAPELLERVRQEARLLQAGYALPAARPRARRSSERRAIYALSQSLPHHSSGYSIRSHWMLRHLAARGWEMTGATRFGYPADRSDQAGRAASPPALEIDDVSYRFRPDEEGFRAPVADYIARAGRELALLGPELRPSLIHAASNFQVGLAAAAAARTLAVPFIYEVRGLWHLTRASKDPEYDDSDHYRMSERLEVDAAQAADHVFVITRAVLDLLAARGVPREKMSLLPNAVDAIEFAPRPREDRLAARLGLTNKVVIGTVGTFKHYEGLSLLLDAAAAMRRSLGDRFRLLLVGDGPEMDALTQKRTQLGLDDIVTMTGRVPHDEVARYYALIDVAAYPRTGARVCHFVSPLKPLESMAMAKAVVVSDVKAQAEMVEDGVTGLVVPADDARALERALTRLVGDAALRHDLGARARSWASAHRSWPAIAAAVTDVYDRLLSG